MLKLRYSAPAMMLLLTVGTGLSLFAAELAPSIPEAHAATVSVTLTGCAFVVGACTSSGWNGTTTPSNPTITVRQGDTVSVTLSSSDGLTHRFLVDADRDGASDTADCPSVDPCSGGFLTTPTTYTFTANIAPGTYTYFCTLHPTVMLGSFVVVGGSVGGTVVPVDTLALLAPYISFASIVIALASATLVYARRYRNRKHK